MKSKESLLLAEYQISFPYEATRIGKWDTKVLYPQSRNDIAVKIPVWK